jgi:predicted GIY-YIG superfamily endonuclease
MMDMQYVYILQSINFPERYYIGCTHDVAKRLHRHNNEPNSSGSRHTANFGPWKIINTFGFEDANKAFAFEKYLKTGSGRAFCKRHF